MSQETGRVVDIESLDQFTTLLEEARGVPVLVKVGATWCPPCKRIEPHFRVVASETPNLHCVSVDVDKARAVAAMCQARVLPTFVVFYKGELVPDVQLVGASASALSHLAAAVANLDFDAAKKHSNSVTGMYMRPLLALLVVFVLTYFAFRYIF
ncbi:MAG: hypothetical protein MHM6MM_004015 [Cercozoa sp. M6MM]